MEEFFWLVEQSVPVFHAAIAEVNGRTTIRQWKNAFDAMQIRYPLLSASIRKIPGQRPFFEKVPGASMPLRIAPLTDSIVLEEEMEEELQRSFGDGSGPLTRATLFHSPGRSVVMFATHHSSFDGKSHLLLLQDLLASLAGEDLGQRKHKVQPGLAQLLGLPAPAEYTKTLTGRSVAPEDGTSFEIPKARVHHLQLSVTETGVLLQRAREERTTVHAALIVALTLAGRQYSHEWNVGPVRCVSPIDMRKTLGIPDAPGLLLSIHHGVVSADRPSFWDMARAVREDILPALSLDGAQHAIGSMSSMVEEEHNARDLYWSAVNGPLAHDLLLTNYAGYRIRTEYEDLKIQNLFTGSTAVSPAVQKVSVLTVNGRLGMTLVARDIFPTLLEDAREILIHL